MTLTLNDTALWREENYINGQWRGADARLAVTNPATGDVLVQVPNMGREAAEEAIAAAEQALPAWRGQSAKARSHILRRWYELMLEHREDLARLLTTEQGKPLAEARGEIAYAAAYIEWYSENHESLIIKFVSLCL